MPVRLHCLLLIAAALGVLALPSTASAGTEFAHDPSFANAGSFTLANPGSDRALAVKALADGTVLVAGRQTINAVEQAVVCRLTASGLLDAGFGAGGCVRPIPGAAKSEITAIEVDGLGRIVLAGVSHDTGSIEGFVVRLLVSGAPDLAFDGSGRHDLLASSTKIQPTDVDVGADNSIVVVGEGGDVVLWKVSPEGADDLSFNAPDGYLDHNVAGDVDPSKIVRSSDGLLYVVGSLTPVGEQRRIVVLRYSATGTPDASFDGDGVLTIQPPGSTASFAASAIMQPGNRLVVGGEVWLNDQRHPVALRLDEGGALDSGFGPSGSGLHIGVGSNHVIGVEADPTGGMYLVSGSVVDNIAHLSFDGRPDDRFSRASDSLGGSFLEASVDGQGRLVLAGYRLVSGGDADVSVVRLTAVTTPDTTASSKIRKPSKRRLSRRHFKTISGVASSSANTTVASVFVAIRRKDSKQLKRKRCVWIADTKGREMTTKDNTRKCAPTGKWLAARGTSTWSLRLKKKLRSGSYVIFSRAVTKAGPRETTFSKRLGNLRSLTLTK